MVRILRSQQLHLRPIELDAVVVPEVRIAPRLLAHPQKINRSRLLIHTQYLRHIPIAIRNLRLLLARDQIKQVQLSPIVLLAEPEISFVFDRYFQFTLSLPLS